MAAIILKETEAKVYHRWMSSPFYWLKDCIFTIDEARANLGFQALRPFPIAERYLQLAWFIADTYPVSFWNKSRRMLFTWLFCTRLLYKCCFNQGMANFIISKKFTDADMLLVRRVKLAYDNIPIKKEILLDGKPTMIYPREMHPEMKQKEGIIEFPKMDSFIEGIPAGADQLRSRTASNIFWDEIAAQQKIMQTWAAIQPTIQGGGAVVGVSTPQNNQFKNLFYGIGKSASTYGLRNSDAFEEGKVKIQGSEIPLFPDP